MKIHRILIDSSLVEQSEDGASWHIRVRAEVKPGGKPKLMQRNYMISERTFREQSIKTFQQIGMDLSTLHMLDEGAIA